MKQRREERRRKTVVCTNLKQTNVVWPYAVYRAILGKMLYPIYKKEVWMSLKMFLTFLSMILVDI